MFVLGLTGGIGSGKSAVAACFKEYGIKVVDADIAARRVVEPGTPSLQAIAEHFGPQLLQDDGTMDRAALRAIVFNDEQQRLWLEQLLHPAIGEWIATELASATTPYAILESPLLLETAQRKSTQRALVVDVSEELQIERATARDNNSREQIEAIIAAQLPRKERLALADDVIDNSGSLADLQGAVDALHQQYLKIAATFDAQGPA
ncbi:MAG: dephospho-CoA kinase [Gammaproteobacteria bacterium]|nr:dephospho-CoA kinase [Gammaproteobacteria bacterium]MBQ0838299.1 dephospho-CoA kinase [Gammaproteobacteria bacterium]